MSVMEQTGVFRLASERAIDRHDWGTTSFVCHPDSTGARQLAVLDAVIEPGGGHAFHMHPEQEELLLVVAGQVEQWVDREMRVLGPGDAAFLPAGVVHASFNAGDAPARVVAIFGPCLGDAFNMVDKASEEPWSRLRP